ncbi:hemolysin family protein [Helcococcus kunzii]
MDNPQAVPEVDLGNGNLLGQLILIIILTLINAFFAASEMAMVSVDQGRLKHDAEDGDKKAESILNLLKDQSNLLSVIQVAITLAGFLNSASAATGISIKLGYAMSNWGVPYSRTVSQILITLILSFITIVFGELIPKRVAIVRSEEFARTAVGTISFVNKLFKPFVWLLSKTTNLFLKLLGIRAEDMEARITINDIKSLVQQGHSQGIIDAVESEMINSVINFDETYAEEIMTPRTEVFMIDINDEFSEYKDDMLSLKYSRIPVYNEDVDNIIGVLYLKDYLLESYIVGFENVNIRKIMKPAYFVPERKNINELFSELQTNNRHMALLIDEYGGFAGIVTMEDLIEEIVGNIDDEYDHDEPEIRKISDDVYEVKASISIRDFNYETGSKIDEETDDYDTIGGLIIYLLGYIPNDEEKPKIDYENLSIQVLEVKDKRIITAKITVYDEFTHKREDDLENEIDEAK